MLLAQVRPDQAMRLVERLDAMAAAQQRTGSLIEIQALLALVLAANRQTLSPTILLPGVGDHAETMSMPFMLSTTRDRRATDTGRSL